MPSLKSYFLFLLAGFLGLLGDLSGQTASTHIVVDQFGYRPLAKKVAVLRQAMTGYDAPDSFTPSVVVELRRSSDDATVFTAAPTPWLSGATHGQSGDRAWWFDFSSYTTEGTYYVLDPASGERTEDFQIIPNVYQAALRDSVRMLYYQRCGTPKLAAYAGVAWEDAQPCHIYTEQDTDCRLISNPVPSTSLDLSGGWHDAGDHNKYINYIDDSVIDLLMAFEEHPNDWTDDYGIPESGNGIPDLLDEVRYELEWMLRMQQANGSVIHKVAAIDFGYETPPSAELLIKRRYGDVSASATLSCASAFAFAAQIYRMPGDASSTAFADVLESAAVAAWDWVEQNPSEYPSSFDNTGFPNADAEDDTYIQSQNRLRAAQYLYEIRGEARFKNYFEAEYRSSLLFVWFWAYAPLHPFQEPLLRYMNLSDANPVIAADIRDQYQGLMESWQHIGHHTNGDDPYLSYMENDDYNWGSNRTTALAGLMYTAMNRHGMDTTRSSDYLDAGEQYMHYLHGVNPLGLCYLTNMEAAGAEGSVTQMYHLWFGEGSEWDNTETSLYGPPPGFLVGGPNQYYAPSASYSGPPLTPPQFQPVMKSYLDFNDWWPMDTYKISEPQVEYQTPYVRLLAEFAFDGAPELGLHMPQLSAGTHTNFSIGGVQPSGQVALLFAVSRGHFSLDNLVWAVDLDLAIQPPILSHVVSLNNADLDGEYHGSLSTPPSASGFTVFFQAAEGGSSPYPVQSGVVKRTLP